MEFDNFQDLFAEAEALRIAHQPTEALVVYERALQAAHTTEELVTTHHMMGVAHGMAHYFDNALLYLDHALEVAIATSCDLSAEGNIQRDRARQLWAMERWAEAEEALERAMSSHLKYAGPEELGATLGFYGRMKKEMGATDAGISWMKAAHALLHQGDNRHWELYNALNLAEALLEAGDGSMAAKVALLCISLVDEGFGDEPHRQRALGILRIAQGPH